MDTKELRQDIIEQHNKHYNKYKRHYDELEALDILKEEITLHTLYIEDTIESLGL